jgi:hypothetical protein
MKKPRRKTRSQSTRRSGSTVAQLRDDIDSGRTGEKVDWPDPAAAPLGTDEEAAGTPIARRAVAKTRRRERKRPASPASRRHPPRVAWLQVALVVALIAAALGWIVVQL